MNFVCFNGEMLPDDKALFNARNHSFRYGDGVFETIRVNRGNIPLGAFHFERLFTSLQLLKIKASFDETELAEMILALCRTNGCEAGARVRLAVYRSENQSAGFCIEANPLSEQARQWNEKGFRIGIYPYARKSMDGFSNLKSANFLPYVLAGIHAKEKGLDDCIVLNCDNHLADTSRANIFLIRGGELFTPALHQGCINGVMRRFLADALKKKFRVHQQEITENDLLEADEVFLTNAIFGMRWVQDFRDRTYDSALSRTIYGQIVSAIYA